MANIGQIINLEDLNKLPDVGQSISLDQLSSLPDISNQQSQSTQKQPGFYDRNIAQPLGEIAEGVGKGVLSTVNNTAKLGSKLLTGIFGTSDIAKGTKFAGGEPFDPNNQTNQKIEQVLQPTNTLQKVGKGAEQIAEFFIPAGEASKAEKAVDLISQGIKSGLGRAVTRILGKSAVQGIAAGGVKLAQSGDVGAAAETGASAGIFRGTLAVIGEGARALHIPERLYSTIFKNSSRDMLAELRANGIEAFRQSNPQRFQEFVQSGIVKVGADGQPILNETLAEKALDKGLRGSVRGMANTVVQGALESESKVRTIASHFKGTVNLPEEQFINVLKRVGQEYQDVGFGEVANEAKALTDKLVTSGGSLAAEDALAVRRFFDKIRITSSYDRPASSLSLTQSNLKTLSDAIRGRFNAIPGMKEVMKDYSFYIDALESLAKEAARRGNNQVLSLIDSLFLSGASGNNPLVSPTMGIYRRLLMSAPGTTGLGSLLNKSNASPLTSGALGGTSGALFGQRDQSTP